MKRNREKIGIPSARQLDDSSPSSSSIDSDEETVLSDQHHPNHDEHVLEDTSSSTSNSPDFVENLEINEPRQCSSFSSTHNNNVQQNLERTGREADISRPPTPDIHSFNLDLSDSEEDEDISFSIERHDREDLEVDPNLLFDSSNSPFDIDESYSLKFEAPPTPGFQTQIDSGLVSSNTEGSSVGGSTKLNSTREGKKSVNFSDLESLIEKTSALVPFRTLDAETDYRNEDEYIIEHNSQSSNSVANLHSEPGNKRQIRQQYSDLIEECHELEEKDGFDEQIHSRMKSNIEQGKALLEKIVGASGPGDMFLAFSHTQACTRMLKHKTLNIGNNRSSFKLDVFLESIVKEACVETTELDVESSVKYLSNVFAECSLIVNPISAIMGTFDRNKFLGREDEFVEEISEKKQRKKKLIEEEQEEHQHVTVPSQEVEGFESIPKNQESLSKEILSALKKHYHIRTGRQPINIFEFCLNPSSFQSTIENLFLMAFLVHEGYVEFFREQYQPKHDYSISICPSIPTQLAKRKKKKREKKKSNYSNNSHGRKSGRSQYILSFSAADFREMCKMAEGDPLILPIRVSK